jgi:hypothetical protein
VNWILKTLIGRVFGGTIKGWLGPALPIIASGVAIITIAIKELCAACELGVLEWASGLLGAGILPPDAQATVAGVVVLVITWIWGEGAALKLRNIVLARQGRLDKPPVMSDEIRTRLEDVNPKQAEFNRRHRELIDAGWHPGDAARHAFAEVYG